MTPYRRISRQALARRPLPGRKRVGRGLLARSALTACSALVLYLAVGAGNLLAEKLSALDQTFSPPTPESASAAAEDDAAVNRLEPGDKLKITIYGRQDITGDYRIDDSGLLRIPTLAALEAAGRTAAELEERIVAALEAAQQRKADATVEIVERRPIYVTGVVAKPGAYPFAAGMTVLHAVAVAGGSAEAGAATWLPAEAVRETARIQASQAELKFLLADKARLEAERDGSGTVATPPELIALVGEDAANELIRNAQAVLERQLAALERDRRSFETAMEESRNELSSFNSELEKLNEQRTLREAWSQQIQGLAKQGLTSTQRVFDSQILLATTDRDAQAAIAAVARGQRTLERAERDLEMLTLERKLRIEQELQSVNQQVARLKATITGSEMVVEKISKMPSALISLDRAPSYEYEVMRKGPSGKAEFISLDETNLLKPGDVLRVKVNRFEFRG